MSRGTAGRGAPGRLGLPEVGLEGGGATEEEGVGRSTGGARRRDRSETVTWIHVPVAISRAERWISFI